VEQGEAFKWLGSILAPEQAKGFAERFGRGKADPEWLALALAFMRQDGIEGCYLTSYPDPETGGEPWTIGWGNTRINGKPVTPGLKINQELADSLQRAEALRMAGVLANTVPAWPGMSQRQRAALVSFAFNCGEGFMSSGKHQTIERALREGRLSDVPAALMLYINRGGPTEKGLTKRRRLEGELWGLPPAKGPVLRVPAQQPGMAGPGKTPHQFGFKAGDTHLIVDDLREVARAFDFEGKELWRLPALARGQGGDTVWSQRGSDTPPGLYKVGTIYRDWETAGGDKAGYSADRQSYGWYSLDLIELEGQEVRYGRAGIMIHGGGSACGWPGAASGCTTPT
jgi:GH24 family phage-related lysozyme (muramidase)